MKFTKEDRILRLKHEYEEMVGWRNQSGWLDWDAVTGDVPCITSYLLTLRVETIITSTFDYREVHEVKVVLPAAYPETKPEIDMVDKPAPYHPNWFPSGRWCDGLDELTWDPATPLVDHLIRMVRTLEFDLEVSNPRSPTDSERAVWFCEQSKVGKFPISNIPKKTLDDEVFKFL